MRICRNSVYCLCNFSVSLELFQNKKGFFGGFFWFSNGKMFTK